MRGFDDARYIELPGRGANCVRGTVSLQSGQTRIKPIELPDLAIGAPAEITGPGVPEIGVGDGLEAARRIEPRGKFVAKALVLHEAAVACQPATTAFSFWLLLPLYHSVMRSEITASGGVFLTIVSFKDLKTACWLALSNGAKAGADAVRQGGLSILRRGCY